LEKLLFENKYINDYQKVSLKMAELLSTVSSPDKGSAYGDPGAALKKVGQIMQYTQCQVGVIPVVTIIRKRYMRFSNAIMIRRKISLHLRNADTNF